MKLPTELQKFSENNDDVLIEAIARYCAKVCADRARTMSELNYYGAVASNQCATAILGAFDLEELL